MEDKLNCEIVRDLLPSYVEGLTSPASNTAIENHLAGCAECTASLKRMREPEETQPKPSPELDYLKKLRRRSTVRSLIVCIILMALGISILAFRFFYVGSSIDPSQLSYSVQVDGNRLTVGGSIVGSSGLSVSRLSFSDSNGIVELRVYSTVSTFFNSGDFTQSYTAAAPITQVRMGGLIIWQDGVEISPLTSRLFAQTNPYVGDMPSNNSLAQVLGIAGQFGPYSNQLQTDEQPYGWTLILENPIQTRDEVDARRVMAADSYLLLACIENLGYVSWQYDSPSGVQTYTVTAQDASDYAGQDIKSYDDSATRLQELVESLSLNWSGLRSSSVE